MDKIMGNERAVTIAMKRPSVKVKHPAATQRAVRQMGEKELARLASFPERNPNPVMEADLTGCVHYLNPAARRLLPGIAQSGVDHPWLADWPAITRALRHDPSKPIVRELAIKARFYHQTIYYAEDMGRIRIYGTDITRLKELENKEKERAFSHIAARTAMDTIGAMRIGVVLIRMSGSIASVNPAFETMTGYNRDEIAGKDARNVIGKIVVGDDRARILNLLKDAGRGKSTASLAITLRTKTGATVPVIVDLTFIKDPKGAPSSIVVTLKDVTERRKAEEQLRKNETRLLEAQRIAHFGNWDWNIATGELVWSDEIFRIFGRRPQEFGATYDAFLKSIHPEDRKMVQAAVDKALRNELAYDIDHRIVLSDGAERVVREHGEVFRDKAGRPVRMAGTVQDVTEHKKTERRKQMITTLLALFARKSSRKEYLDAVVKVLQQACDCRCIGIRVVEEKGRIPYAASIGLPPRFIKIENALVMGRDACVCTRVLAGKPEPQDLAGITSGGSFRCDNLPDFMADLTAKGKKRFRGMCVKSGFASVAVVPIKYHDHMFGAIHLADERQGKLPPEQINFVESFMAPIIGEAISWFDMDQSLRRVGAYNRSLIEASLDPLVTIDAKGKITDVNAATEKITGRSRTELIGTDFADYFTDHEQAKSGYKQVFRDGWVQDYALEIRHRDGRVTPVLYNASVYRDEEGRIVGVFAAARDITARKRAEEALHLANAYNRSLIEASLDPLVTIDAKGKITDVNAATEKITGRSRTELIGTDFADYFTDFEQAQSGYQRVFRDGWVQDYALEIRSRDGRVTPVLYNASVYRDAKGKVVGIFAAARDITERKQAEAAIADYQQELRSLSSRLSLAEESARRQLAVALHDTVVQTQALAQIKLDVLGAQLTGRKARQAWTEIRRMLENAIQQTRTLSFELSPPILYELGLDPALEWLGEEFQRRHGFRFHFDCAGDKSNVGESLCVFIFQSARELLTNIVKHAHARHVYVSSRLADGQIVVSIRDDGQGFDPDARQPGDHKKSLGLFSIRERMRFIGGQCRIEAMPGKGATITLSVPEALQTTEQAAKAADANAPKQDVP